MSEEQVRRQQVREQEKKKFDNIVSKSSFMWKKTVFKGTAMGDFWDPGGSRNNGPFLQLRARAHMLRTVSIGLSTRTIWQELFKGTIQKSPISWNTW